MDSYDDSSTGKEKRSKHKSSKSDERSKRALQRVKEESAKFTLSDRRALAKAKAGSPAKKRPRSESSSSEESSGSSLLSSHVKPKAKSKKSKGVRIWINGLSSDINEGVIKATFERYGSIKSITMYRGSCSLEYKDSAGAFNALKERDNTNFHGSTIRVSDRPPLPPTPVTAPPTKGKEQKPATRQPPPEEKELWIGGLGPHYNEAYIQGMLEVFGDVVSLEVHNGWCYAKFKYPDDAAAALKELQSGTLLHGSNIQAKYKKDVNPAKIEAEYPSSWEKPAEPSKSKAEPILKKRAARSESAESVASRSPSREQRKAARANKGAEQPPVDWRAHPAAMGMGYYYPPYPDPAAWEAMMARGGPYPPAPYPMPYPPYPMPRPGENPYQKTSPRRSRSRDRKDDRDRDRDRSDRDREREKDKDKDKERGRSRSRSKSRDRDRDRKDDRSRSKERSPKRKERSRSHERSRKDRSRSRDRRSRSRSRDRSRKRSRSPKRSRSRSRSRPKKELDRNFRKDWYADDANVKRGMDEEAIKAGRELWVGGLDPESDDVEPVRTLFEKHGVVTAISLRKAWCFLTYSDPESAKEAIDQLDGHKAFGRPLRVTLRTLPPGARDRGGSPKRGNSPS